MDTIFSVRFTETRARASATMSSSVSEVDEFQSSLLRTSPLVGSVRTENTQLRRSGLRRLVR